NNKLIVNKVQIIEPFANVYIFKNKTTNLSDILIKQSEDNNTQKRSDFSFVIANLLLKNGTLNFADDSLPIEFKSTIENMNAQMLAVGSHKSLPTTIVLKGEIPKYGLAQINATLSSGSILDNSNIDLEFSNIDIDTLSPYSIKFLGYKLKDGKLWLDLNYKIKNSQLSSINKIKIKDLELGEKVDDTTSLPIELAISLLSDSDGYINFEIPVSGSIDNPNFELGGAIKDAIFQAISNVVTAPFKFLGSLFNSDEEELSHILFEFGKYDILPPQKEVLDKLIEILSKRPQINIEINGAYSKSEDLHAIKLRKFNSKMLKDYGENDFGLDKYDFIKKEFIKRNGQNEFLKLAQNINLKDEAKQEELINSMIQIMVEQELVDSDRLTTLAQKRANAIKDYILQNSKIDSKRINVGGDFINSKQYDDYSPSQIEVVK
ncbi:MAG: hypothetical protein RL154_1681, partial [Pseudomonadota bacterium]